MTTQLSIRFEFPVGCQLYVWLNERSNPLPPVQLPVTSRGGYALYFVEECHPEWSVELQQQVNVCIGRASLPQGRRFYNLVVKNQAQQVLVDGDIDVSQGNPIQFRIVFPTCQPLPASATTLALISNRTILPNEIAYLQTVPGVNITPFVIQPVTQPVAGIPGIAGQQQQPFSSCVPLTSKHYLCTR